MIYNCFSMAALLDCDSMRLWVLEIYVLHMTRRRACLFDILDKEPVV